MNIRVGQLVIPNTISFEGFISEAYSGGMLQERFLILEIQENRQSYLGYNVKYFWMKLWGLQNNKYYTYWLPQLLFERHGIKDFEIVVDAQ